MSHSNPFLLTYDVGGSHATAALIRAASLEMLAVDSYAIDSQAPAEEVLRDLEAVGKQVLANYPTADLLGIAMAMPGPFDYEEGVSRIHNLTKYDNLYGVNLRRAMAVRFPRVAPEAVRFVNDAQAALLGEVHCGAAVGVSRVMGLTLGTGVGSAFVVDGRIVTTGPGVPAQGYVYCLPWNGGTLEGCHLGARPSTPISGADRGALRGAGNRRAGACRRRCRGELGVAGIRKNSRHGSQARGNSIPSGSDGPGRSHSPKLGPFPALRCEPAQRGWRQPAGFDAA